MPSSSKKEWGKETLDPAVQRFHERQEKFQTDSGLEIDSLYSPEDLTAQGHDYHRDLGYPGEFPYTRGVQPNTYRGRIWTMRQYSGYATAADTIGAACPPQDRLSGESRNPEKRLLPRWCRGGHRRDDGPSINHCSRH